MIPEMLSFNFQGMNLTIEGRWNKFERVLAADALRDFAVSTIEIFGVLGEIGMATGGCGQLSQQDVGFCHALIND